MTAEEYAHVLIVSAVADREIPKLETITKCIAAAMAEARAQALREAMNAIDDVLQLVIDPNDEEKQAGAVLALDVVRKLAGGAT